MKSTSLISLIIVSLIGVGAAFSLAAKDTHGSSKHKIYGSSANSRIYVGPVAQTVMQKQVK